MQNFDKDGDSKVSPAEFFLMVPRTTGAVAAFGAEDRDSDGLLRSVSFSSQIALVSILSLISIYVYVFVFFLVVCCGSVDEFRVGIIAQKLQEEDEQVEEQRQTLFKVLDADGNGEITLAEFTAKVSKRGRGSEVCVWRCMISFHLFHIMYV